MYFSIQRRCLTAWARPNDVGGTLTAWHPAAFRRDGPSGYSVGSLLVQSVYLALNESVHDDIFWLPLEIWRLRPRGGRVGPRRAGHRRRRRGEQRRRGGERRARGWLADGIRAPRGGGRRRRGPAVSCRRGSS